MQLGEASVNFKKSLEMRERSQNYVSGIATALHQFRCVVGDQPLEDMKMVAAVRDYAEWLMARDIAPATFNLRRSNIKVFVDYLSLRELTPEPGKVVLEKAEWFERTIKHRKWIRLQVREMLDIPDLIAHPVSRIYVTLGINTGMRTSEIAPLRVDDINLDTQELYKVDRKTKQVDETFPINQALAERLRDYLTWYAQRLARQGLALKGDMYLCPSKVRGTYAGWKDDEFIDTDLNPYHQVTNPERIVQECLRGAGYEGDLRGEGMHTLRRSAALAMFNYYSQHENPATRDEALKMVQVTLGHKTVTMTERYLGLDQFRDKRNVAVKGGRFLEDMLAAADNVTQLPKRGTA